jgi:hypothetical protein
MTNEKSFKITLKRCTEISDKWNKIFVHINLYLAKGASHKKLWKTPPVEVSHSVADFGKVPPYIFVTKDKGKPKSTILTLKLGTDSKKITKWKIDIADFWNKSESMNTILYTDKGPRMIVTIVDTKDNMTKVKSEYEESSSTQSSSKMPTYTPSKKSKKSMSSKLRGKSVSRSASDFSSEDNSSDWESSSEMEGDTRMLFEACSMEDPEIKGLGEHELPPLNFDLGGLLNGAFIKTDGSQPNSNNNSMNNNNVSNSNIRNSSSSNPQLSTSYAENDRLLKLSSKSDSKSRPPSATFAENRRNDKDSQEDNSRDRSEEGGNDDTDSGSQSDSSCKCIIV